jgi:hypothetical protein
MAMPEAAVNQNHSIPARKDEIRSFSSLLAVKTKAIAPGVG